VIDVGIVLGKSYVRGEGKDSKEYVAHTDRMSKKLGTLYSKDSQIPAYPCMDNILNAKPGGNTRQPVAIPCRDVYEDCGSER
jgi:hypothetical protein